jgi:hypothetical protein
MTFSTTSFSEALSMVDWYVRCLEDVQDGRVVRGLAEAKAGYDSAMTTLGKSVVMTIEEAQGLYALISPLNPYTEASKARALLTTKLEEAGHDPTDRPMFPLGGPG